MPSGMLVQVEKNAPGGTLKENVGKSGLRRGRGIRNTRGGQNMKKMRGITRGGQRDPGKSEEERERALLSGVAARLKPTGEKEKEHNLRKALDSRLGRGAEVDQRSEEEEGRGKWE